MWQASGTYLLFERGEAIWHPQMTFHLIVGTIFFVFSLVLFERFNQHAIALGSSASVSVSRGLKWKAGSLRSLRCWNAALEWKSWYFNAGGHFWFLVWLISLPVLSVGIVIFIGIMVGEVPPAEGYGIALMLVGTASFVILLARLFGNFLNREIHEQTLVSLCMLPRGRGEILIRLSLGMLPFTLPPVACFALGCLWMTFAENWFLRDVMEVVSEPWFWAGMGWVFVTVHLGTLISVYFRHGGMLIAVAVCWFVLPFMLGMLVGAVMFLARGIGGNGQEVFFRYLVPMVAMAAEVVVCILVQRLILRRVEELAAR